MGDGVELPDLVVVPGLQDVGEPVCQATPHGPEDEQLRPRGDVDVPQGRIVLPVAGENGVRRGQLQPEAEPRGCPPGVTGLPYCVRVRVTELKYVVL